MKQIGWVRKICLGSCMNAKGPNNLDGLTISAERVDSERSRATIAEATGGIAIGAVALGALAIGGFTVGLLVIGRLIIREMRVLRVHLRNLKVDQLEVEDLRVNKLTVLNEQRSAGSPDNPPVGLREFARYPIMGRFLPPKKFRNCCGNRCGNKTRHQARNSTLRNQSPKCPPEQSNSSASG